MITAETKKLIPFVAERNELLEVYRLFYQVHHVAVDALAESIIDLHVPGRADLPPGELAAVFRVLFAVSILDLIPGAA
jgi:hypothetical protein